MSEEMKFEAEVSQLLQLMIHSLYSNPEIFLRELISNSSDACDKLRFEAVSDASLLESDSDLAIEVSFDADAGTITVSDNGIGMSRDEVVQNIGTIAKSGTKQFLESLTGDQKTDSALIGQFGVGFYSAFVIAEKVDLQTRRAGLKADEAVLWSSDGTGGYSLDSVTQERRGTTVTLYVKDEHKNYVDHWQLHSIVKKYSDHVTFPIMMMEQVPPPAEPAEGEEPEAPKTPELQQVNAASALWTRSKSDITDEDYQSFYKQVCNDYEDAIAWSHNRVEGNYEYTSLLYLPKRAPFDLYESLTPKNGIKLFVQRVFIMDDAEKLMPRYLRFVRGLVDSNDLPLNVSREILQDNKVIASIRRASTKKVIGMLSDLAENKPDDYKEFWTQFGNCLKEAPFEDPGNQEEVAKLYRFDTTHTATQGELTGLDDYLARMQSGQDKIYYIVADNYSAASNSPNLEIFREKGIEVLLMHEPIDKFLMEPLREYDGKSFVSIAESNLDLDGVGMVAEDSEKKAEKEKQAAEAEPLIKRIKAILEEDTSDVRASVRLTSSPASVVKGESAIPLQMQQMFKQAGQEMPANKPVLEVNATHPILDLMDKEQDEDKFANWSRLLLDQAMLAEGEQLADGAGFVKRMNKMFMAMQD